MNALDSPGGEAPAAVIPNSITPGARFAGAMDFLLEGAGLRGWALDLANPGRPVALGVRCRGVPLATAHAVMGRPDIDAAVGRRTECGFLIGWSRFDGPALAAIAAEAPEAELEVHVLETGQRVPNWRDPVTAGLAARLREAAPEGDRHPRFREVNACHAILDAGLFDAPWYAARHAAAVPLGLPPLLHYLREGEAEGLRPNLAFDPRAYAAAAGLPGPAGALLHFLGPEAAPLPAEPGHFDAAWYAARHPGLARPAAALAHYLAHRATESPNPFFDRDAYAAAAGLAGAAGEDAYAHFLDHGLAAGLRPWAGAAPEGGEAWLAALRGAARPAPAATAEPTPGTRAEREAAEAVRALAAAQPMTPEAIAEALRRAHAWHEAGEREAAATLYRALHAATALDALGLTRLLERAIAARALPEAEGYAATLEARFPDDPRPWSAIERARLHLLRGQPARAVAVLAALPPAPLPEVAAEAAAQHALIEAGDLAAAAIRVEACAAEEAVALFAARLRLAVRQQDAMALAALLEDPRARALPNWVLTESMDRLGATLPPPDAPLHRIVARLYRMVAARGLDDLPIVQSRLLHLLNTRQLDELEALFEALEATPFARARPVLLRRLEQRCLANDPAGAAEVWAAHFAGRPLDRWEGLAGVRLLGELGRWEEAAQVLLAHVSAGHGLGEAGPMALRVVRRTALHEPLIEAAGAAPPAELAPFLRRVREDLALLRGERHRSPWVVIPAPGAETPAAEAALFLCADERYFLGMLATLCSVFGQAPQTGAAVTVFLDRDVPSAWHGAVAMVAGRFGRSVALVPETGFVPRGVALRTGYGFFAGGASLSRAAYLRLYAARHLLRQGGLARAVYLDADTVCRADLSELLTLDLAGQALAAATEDRTPEVVTAAARHGLDPRHYFNSGVLLLAMDDPAMPALIEEAIRICEQEPERLLFQDQCALNIVFRDRVRPLPPRWNHFLRPGRERNGHIEDGAILHFLDKPKPWDIGFARGYREEWRVWALLLAAILPQGLYADIFAAANRE